MWCDHQVALLCKVLAKWKLNYKNVCIWIYVLWVGRRGWQPRPPVFHKPSLFAVTSSFGFTHRAPPSAGLTQLNSSVTSRDPQLLSEIPMLNSVQGQGGGMALIPRRDPLMSHSALSHVRAAWKAAHIAGEQQLASYQHSSATVIHHALYLLNNAICLCVCAVYTYSCSNVHSLHMLSSLWKDCRSVGGQIPSLWNNIRCH